MADDFNLMAPYDVPDTQGQTSAPDPVYSGTPSYLLSADVHNVSNGQASILDPTTWGDRAENIGKFAVAATARAITSTYNIVPTIGNWFGADMSEVDTGDVLRSFDDDLGQYYDTNRTAIDIVGDVAASFVPGMGGVKVLNWGQRALKLASEGKAGLNLARGFGTLPDLSAKYAAQAAETMAQSTAQFSWINGNVMKSLAAGYGQSALEGAAFEIVASTAMQKSPLFDQHDIGDVFYNSLLGGGLVGGAIFGSLTAASTYGKIKSALVKVDKALNPVRMTTEGVASSSEKMLAAYEDLNATHIKPDTVSDITFDQAVKRSQMQATNRFRESAHGLSDDTGLVNNFVDTLSGADSQQTYSNLMGLDAIGRMTTDLREPLTDAEKAAVRASVEQKGGFKAVGNSGWQSKMYQAEQAAMDAKQQIKTLRLFGEDAGTVYDTIPKDALSFADGFKNEAEVAGAVKGYRFNPADGFDPVTADVKQAQARYIWARNQTVNEGDTIGAMDFPLLERAYEQQVPAINIKHLDGTVEEMKFNSPSDLLNLIENQKQDAYGKILQNAGEDSNLSTAAIAQKLNTSSSYLEGNINQGNRAGDLFALQNASEVYTAQQVAKGAWKNPDQLIPTWSMPQHVQLKYNPDLLKDVDGHVLDATSYLQARQKVYQMGVDGIHSSYVGRYNSDLVDQFGAVAPSEAVKASRFGTAPGMVTSTNENYGSFGAKMQQIGGATNRLVKEVRDFAAQTFNGHVVAIANKQDAAMEMAVLRQQVLQTPEKYVMQNGQLVNRKIVDYENQMAQFQQNLDAGIKEGRRNPRPKMYQIEDAAAPERIDIKNPEVSDFLGDWINHNDSKYLTPQMELRNQQGLPVQDNRGVLYFPGVNPKDMPYHAFVVDPSVTNTGHVKMIWAKDQRSLEELSSKVPKDFNVYYDKDTEDYFKAMQQYEYNLGINQNYMDGALKRSGVAAPFFPQTDGAKVMQDLLSWRQGADSSLARDVVAGKYTSLFQTLEKMDDQFGAAATSQAKGALAIRNERTSSPYRSYINTALDVTDKGAHPLWTGVNNMVEKAFSQLSNNVSDIWAQPKSQQQLDDIHAAFQKAGVNIVPMDAATELLANHPAGKPVLSKFIRSANSVLSTLMLRADPLNAVNNGLGANVLLGSETTGLVRAIRNGNQEAAGDLAKLAEVSIPGVEQSSMLSPSKLISNAYSNYFGNIINKSDGGAMMDFYRANGWVKNVSDQVRDTLENLSLRGNESIQEMNTRISKVQDWMKEVGNKAEKWTGNTFAEEMNRFVAADVARQISDIGVNNGIISKSDQLSYINTFLNRTQGNYLASQRPALFQGPVGQAIGLFQTYQFNLLQQIFRHVSEGSAKDAAILLGLQGSIYGMNGLPAFNAINQYVVGQAAGNVSNRDIISTTYDAAGKEAADWLLYGLSSNMFLHPDLKTNLYSRGDINPRQVTVVPTNIADVPIVGFATKMFSAVKEVADKTMAGAPLWPTLMQGIEHSGISRPLAGMAQVAEAFGAPNGMSYSTTTKGDIVMQNDLFSLANLTRLVGGKPLDEAVARDALYRVQAYQSADAKKLNALGEAVKASVIAGGSPDEDQLNGFISKYAALGGKQQNFSSWMHRLVMNANSSQVNQITQKLSNPHSQYMQSIMGGMYLDDPTKHPMN